jgi:transglutaminase-like putative cysteine protease
MRITWSAGFVLLVTSALTSVAGTATADPWIDSARYRFEYRVDFSALAAAPPERLRVWLPYPAETNDQRILGATVDAPWPYRETSDTYGNRIVYLEGSGAPGAPVVMRFDIERKPSAGVPRGEVTPGSPLDPARYLRRAALVPIDGLIQQVAAQESRGLTSERDKIRAFYDYVVRNMSYNKEGTGWGRGDAIWACKNKRGNCTDFHSLFIGMALSQGIPARFLIGFPIPASVPAGSVPGYHCWAEYYDPTRGWVPVDTSEAKKSGRSDAYFGALPNDRIQFAIGRDLRLEPPQGGAPLNYFIYPYAEADGKPVADLAASFRFERQPISTAQR